jgi:CDP-6-deoxy-D-xylo-4-hexulose-3-dehydrase
MKKIADKYKIPLVKNTFTNDLLTRLKLSCFIMTSSKLTMGKKCLEFEKKFAEFNKCNHSILVNSGSSANLVLLQAMKNMDMIKDGDLIAFNSVTWATNVMPIIQVGCIPLPVDIDKNTIQVDTSDLERKLEKYDVKVFFLTNALGGCPNMQKVKDLCDKWNVKLIIDNCESLGLNTDKFSMASTYSFYVSHHMSTIEGGAICTNDLRLSAECRLVREHGWIRNIIETDELYYLGKKHGFDTTKKDDLKFAFYDLAYNVRPTEITGFLGIDQLKHVKKNNKKRFKHCNKIITDTLYYAYDCRIILPENIIPFCLPVICCNKKYKIEFIDKLESSGIETRPIVAGNICNQPFFKKYVKHEYYLPGADFIERNGFYIALRPDLTKKEIKLIIDCLR